MGKFEKISYNTLLILLLVLGLDFFALNNIFNIDFVLKYSPDKQLFESTIEKINIMDNILLALSIIFIALDLFIVLNENKVKRFISAHKEMILNLLILFSIIISFLFIGDLILRALYYDSTSTYGLGPGMIKFNERYVHLNKEGVRDREFNISKEEGVYRILILGDSFTFGQGVKNVSDTYPKILESKLGKGFEVMNFGTLGLNTEDELNLLKEKGLKYHPDMIIIGYFLNDFYTFEDTGGKVYTIPYLGVWLRSVSYLYFYIEDHFNNIVEGDFGEKESYSEKLERGFKEQENINYNKDIFKQIKETAEENKIKVVVVVFPILYDLKSYKFQFAHDFVKEVCDENGFYYLDLLPSYQNYSEDKLRVSNQDSHPSKLAQEIAGNYLYNELFNKKNI